VRIYIIIKRLYEREQSRYQAQLRTHPLGNPIFYSRREDRSSKAKRAAEEMFGTLSWSSEVPENLREREPEISSISFVNF
jgi:hypothetical protein